MSDLYSWKPAYSVQIASLDAQHKTLFGLLNRLGSAMDNAAVVARILNELVTYTQTHFAAEEALMEKHRFAGLAAHKAEHDALTGKVVAFQEDLAAAKVCVSSSLLLFLSRWLSNHILKTDKQYSGFLSSKGVR